MIEAGKGIVLLVEAQAPLGHLAGRPVVTVDVDLNGVGKESLQAHVDEAVVGIEKVVIENTLRPLREVQRGLAFPLAQFDAATGLLAADDGDKTFGQTAFVDLPADQRFFVGFAFEVPVMLAGHLLGVVDEFLGALFKERNEVFAAHPQYPVAETVEIIIPEEGQIAFEDDAVMAMQNG